MSSTDDTRTAVDRRARLVGLAAIVVLLLGVVAVVADVPTPFAPLERAAGRIPETTTTTTPPLFPAVADLGGGALRTPTGVVVPIVGGEPGSYVVKTPCFRDAEAGGDRIPGAHVVLDPGHGGPQEPGAVGPSGLIERDVNLDVALRAKALLEAEGAIVVLTRETNLRVSIPTRAVLIQSLRPLVAISIHHNASPSKPSPIPGIEIYHQYQVPESARIGGLIYEELLTAFAPFDVDWMAGDRTGVRSRITAAGTDFYGMVRRTAGVPTVLTESAFISNPSEEAALATEEFRQAEARAIARAVVRYAGTDEPGAGYGDAFVAASSPGGGGGTANCEDPPLR